MSDTVETPEESSEKSMSRSRLLAAAIMFGEVGGLDPDLYGKGRVPLRSLAEYIGTLTVNGRLPSEALLGEKIAERTDWPDVGRSVDGRDLVLRTWEAVRGIMKDLRDNEVDAEIVRRDVREAARRVRVERGLQDA